MYLVCVCVSVCTAGRGHVSRQRDMCHASTVQPGRGQMEDWVVEWRCGPEEENDLYTRKVTSIGRLSGVWGRSVGISNDSNRFESIRMDFEWISNFECNSKSARFRIIFDSKNIRFDSIRKKITNGFRIECNSKSWCGITWNRGQREYLVILNALFSLI